MECLTNLVSLKNIGATSSTPLFWMDDIEGIDRSALDQLTKAVNGSGKYFGLDIIESASRYLITDMETLIPQGYAIKSSLNSFCNTCTYTAFNSGAAKTGVVVKNISTSKNAYLSVDSLKVMVGSSGDYTIVLDDGRSSKTIATSFVSGTEKIITNISYKTAATSVKIYFEEPGVLVQALSCPVSKGCGCSGKKAAGGSTDITVKGLLGDQEFTTQYGFVPCASIVCSLDNVLCTVVNQQPRLFGLALLYRSAARYFSEFQVTQRNNRNASFDEEQKLSLADRYLALYYERLRGSKNVKGIADNMAAALSNVNDPCVECNKTTMGWAIG